MTTMLDAIRKERPWLLLPRPPCDFCGCRPARVGELCCACHYDPEAREQYAAQCAKEDAT